MTAFGPVLKQVYQAGPLSLQFFTDFFNSFRYFAANSILEYGIKLAFGKYSGLSCIRPTSPWLLPTAYGLKLDSTLAMATNRSGSIPYLGPIMLANRVTS